jgi:hypothetical protein
MILAHQSVTDISPRQPPHWMVDSLDVQAPGEYGTGHVDLLASQPIWQQWTGTDFADELVLAAAAQVMVELLATATDQTQPVAIQGYFPLAFERIEYHASVAPRRPLTVTVEIETRFNNVARGTFVVVQNSVVIVTGKLNVMRKA